MGVLYWGYRSVSYDRFECKEHKTRFSIIVPFRNEEKNLPELIRSFQNLNYPSNLFEVLFVDDESTDGSYNIIIDELKKSHLDFSIFKNERYSASPKKDAITSAIKKAQFEWIFTTDADCVLSDEILATYDGYIQKKDPYMIVGPLGLINGKGLAYHLQNFENLGLQTVSAGGFGIQRPFLCNGGNLAYRKDIFDKVDGYLGNDHISSGDDIFLFEKINRKYPKMVHFVKNSEAIVLTFPLKRWKHIIEQRIRWASKTSKQNNPISWILGLTIFLTNLYLVIGFFYSIYHFEYLLIYFLFFFFKSMVDLILVSSSAFFFSKRIHLLMFFINCMIYPFITLLIVIRSFNGKYVWKGRRFSKIVK